MIVLLYDFLFCESFNLLIHGKITNTHFRSLLEDLNASIIIRPSRFKLILQGALLSMYTRKLQPRFRNHLPKQSRGRTEK